VKFSSIGLDEFHPKQIWAAVPLALLFGPAGLLYCTTTGATIMFLVSFILSLFVGRLLAYLIVSPICALWAWRATRETRSALE